MNDKRNKIFYCVLEEREVIMFGEIKDKGVYVVEFVGWMNFYEL